MSLPALPDPTRPFRGRVFKYGDDVNTDVIFPGKYTYTLRSPEEIVPHALEDLDPEFVRTVKPGDVIVAGRNWGCGSSREQAATCLRWSGVGAVIATSFSRIFYRNAINNGLLALVCPDAAEELLAGDQVEVDLPPSLLLSGERRYRFPPMSATVLSILEAGGLVPYTIERLRGRSSGGSEIVKAR